MIKRFNQLFENIDSDQLDFERIISDLKDDDIKCDLNMVETPIGSNESMSGPLILHKWKANHILTMSYDNDGKWVGVENNDNVLTKMLTTIDRLKTYGEVSIVTLPGASFRVKVEQIRVNEDYKKHWDMFVKFCKFLTELPGICHRYEHGYLIWEEDDDVHSVNRHDFLVDQPLGKYLSEQIKNFLDENNLEVMDFRKKIIEFDVLRRNRGTTYICGVHFTSEKGAISLGSSYLIQKVYKLMMEEKWENVSR